MTERKVWTLTDDDWGLTDIDFDTKAFVASAKQEDASAPKRRKPRKAKCKTGLQGTFPTHDAALRHAETFNIDKYTVTVRTAYMRNGGTRYSVIVKSRGAK